jgi:hypothetical protein
MPKGIPNKKKTSTKLSATNEVLNTKANYPDYNRLSNVLSLALEQAAAGKGKARHAQGQPFEQQPMQRISQMLGSAEGMRYQAVKKIQESVRMEDGAAIAELLGAINYLAGTVIYLQNSKQSEQCHNE